MNNRNIEAMELFPRPDELPADLTPLDAIGLLYRICEAARAAVDEITERTHGQGEEDLFAAGTIAEQLGIKATEFRDMLDI